MGTMYICCSCDTHYGGDALSCRPASPARTAGQDERGVPMTFFVWRVMTGRGLVDYCGTVEAASLTEAEDVARLMHPVSAGEELDIEEADLSQED